MVARVLLLLLVLLPSIGEAATYYVATTGSNSNDGLSESAPFLTIGHCTSTMIAGDTCYVRGGTYNVSGEIRFGRTGTQASPIKLLNYPNERPIINYTAQTNFDHILIQNNSGFALAIGWITIEGFEIRSGYEGVKWYNLHDSTIAGNYIHSHANQGILGNGGTRVVITRNIIARNGPLSGTSNLEHGIYAHGSHITITRNEIYGNQAYGIQQNGSSTAVYSATKHPSTEFAGANNWIVSDNLFAYEFVRSGIVVWGSLCDDSRYENNIFFENNVQNSGSTANGMQFTSATGSTGLLIRNNHFYASGSGATAQYSGAQPGDLVSTGNVVNVSAPAFVSGGVNALPASPDFRLTASAPVNIARTNEFPNNSTGVVGPYKTLPSPTGSIIDNMITGIYAVNTAVPIQNLSTTGVTVGCAGTACPGALTASLVDVVAGTDAQFAVTVSGFVGDECLAADQNITLSYNSATGTWTGNDNIGPYPGQHQKMFSFTSLAIANNCDGSAVPDVFSQTAVQFEEVYTSGLSGTVMILHSPNNTKKVMKRGAVAIVAQVECNDCAAASFRLSARDNGGSWLQVENTENAANTYMWGDATAQYLNSGSITSRVLANACTVVTGSTQTTDAQIPSITLPASGCTMLRYIVRVKESATGYTEFRLEQEGGVAFTGSYVLGRIDIVDTSAGGMGF